MKKYVNQLIEDIEAIIKQNEAQNKIQEDSFAENETENYFADVESYLHGERYALAEIVQLPKEKLPSPSELNNEQLNILVPALNNLLQSFNYEPVYPEELSPKTMYKLLYDEWETEQPKAKDGIIGIEFCNFELISCPIPGECSWCLDNNEYEEYELVDSAEEDTMMEAIFEKHARQQNKKDKIEAYKNLLAHAPINENNIAGIYNYCNRWCEKCNFTDRCTSYQFEKELGLSDDIDSIEDAIENVGTMLAATFSLLQSKMFELGIGFNDAEEIDIPRRKSFENKLSKQALALAMQMTNWFKQNEVIFMERMNELWDIDQEKSVLVNDHVSNIGWHMNLIPVKMERAVGEQRYTSDPNDEFIIEDRTATGKLVLECINTSINSLTYLYDNFSDREDEILLFLAALSKLRKALKEELPNAENYIRPGLDE